MDQAALGQAGTALDRVPPALRARLMPVAHMRVFTVGEVVLQDGHATPFLGFVESGRVALRLRVAELGDPVTIVTVEPGELLGWSAVVPPYRATVDAVATAPTAILAVEAAPLRERLATDRDLAMELLPVVLESVAARLTASWHQLLDLFAAPAPEPW